MSDPPNLISRFYRQVLRVYPPDYLDTFGDEMHNTFLDGLEEANSQGTLGRFFLRELCDLPRALANAYWYGWKRRIEISFRILQDVTSASDLPPAPPDGRQSWRQVFLEVSPFLIVAMLLILSTYSPVISLPPGWQHSPALLGKIIPPLALPIVLIGLLRGLPRWAYPFGGLLLGYYGLLAQQTSLWLFLTSMLFLTCALALVTIMTAPQPSLLPMPLRRLGQSVSSDWTRLSFAFYGAMPLIIIMAFDDSHANDRTPYLAWSLLTMVICALLYCRSRMPSNQITALMAGLTLSICGAWLDRLSFVNGLSNWVMVVSSGQTDIFWLLGLLGQWLALLLAPGLLVAIQHAVHVRRVI